MKDNTPIGLILVKLVVNSFQNCIFKDERQHQNYNDYPLTVVNSFQNCIFKDERQHCFSLPYYCFVVNSFQNCIFKDERQPYLEVDELNVRCE